VRSGSAVLRRALRVRTLRRLSFVLAACAACGGSGPVDAAFDGGHTDSAPPPGDGGTPSDGPAADSGGAPDAGNPALVTIASGTLDGSESGGVVSWKGIPYAAPPVGSLRWRAPAPPVAWSGIRNATAFGSECMQSGANGPVGKEDCLFLNVWAPAGFSGQSLPVVFFVHGGGWEIGSGDLAIYDGAYLAARGPAVVVTINYRLGVFGFLSLADLAAEDPSHSTGNYGLLDQIAALRWVRDNIHAFGGDPKRVTLWGQSAGGWSTLMLLTSPPAAGLFSRAFSESGGTSARVLSDAESYGASFASTLHCSTNTLACLRAVDAATAQNTLPTGWWAPVVDGAILPQPVLTTFAAGTQAHVPLMIGTTGSEFSYPGIEATPSVDSVVTESDYESALQANFGAANEPSILALYPAASYPSPQAAYVATVTDAYMTCSTRRIAKAITSSQTQPVWRYLYNHTDTNGPSRQYGPGHFMDVPFWFFNFAAGQLSPDAAETALGQDMTTYLTQFAANGDPNGKGGAVAWPQYVVDSDPAVQLGTPPISIAGVRTSKCDLWDTVYPWEW
jgi:para-nitrobenzyl esterase